MIDQIWQFIYDVILGNPFAVEVLVKRSMLVNIARWMFIISFIIHFLDSEEKYKGILWRKMSNFFFPISKM